MFCNKCGGSLPTDKVLCPHCGAQIPPAAIQISPPLPTQIWNPPTFFYDKHAELRREHPELQGVGGWLAFYAWMNLVFVPLWFVFQLISIGPALRLSLHSPQFFVSSALSFYGFTVGLLIVLQSPWALTNAKIKLAIQLFLAIGYLALRIKRGGAAVYLGSVIGAALWLSYFLVSKRVKLTLDPPVPKR